MEALVVIDMQNYFISDSLRQSFPDLMIPKKIVPVIESCLHEARHLHIPIVHIKTEYKKDKSNWPASKKHRDSLYCMEGTFEAEIISELSPVENEIVVKKSRYTGFFDTELEDWLKQNKIDSIVLAGYALDGCVRFTAVDAYNIGFGTTILRDCVMSSKEAVNDSIEYLQFLIQSDVTDSKAWLSKYDS